MRALPPGLSLATKTSFPPPKSVAISRQCRLQRGAYRKIPRGGGTRDVCAALRVDGDSGRPVVGGSAEVGAVNQSIAARAQFGYENIVSAAIEALHGVCGRKVERIREAGDVRRPARIHRQG